MTWFFIALIGPALWSMGNHIDKYLLQKYLRGGGIGALIIFLHLLDCSLLWVLPLFSRRCLIFDCGIWY